MLVFGLILLGPWEGGREAVRGTQMSAGIKAKAARPNRGGSHSPVVSPGWQLRAGVWCLLALPEGRYQSRTLWKVLCFRGTE